MKARRKWIIALVVGVVGATGLAVLLFSGPFQTWAARRWLAGHPELGLQVGGVAAAPGRLRLQQLRIERDGFSVVVPRLDLDLPLWSALRGEVAISRIVAQGLTVDLTRVADGPAGPPGPAVFPSILSRIRLPMDLSLDGVDLSGEFVIPAQPGEPPVRTRLTIKGGGIGAGRTGRLEFAVLAALPRDAAVSEVEFTGRTAVTMTTPREFSALEIEFAARARGPRLPQGATLAATLSATRANSGEDYAVSLESAGRRIAVVRAVQTAGANGQTILSGAWSLNLADADVSPFTLGRSLPVFRFTGGGRLEADLAASTLAFDGQAELSADRLAAINPRLEPLGALNLAGTFDVRHSAAGWEVRRLALEAAAARPVLALRALQPFAFNPDGSLLKFADRDRDLVAIELRAVPLSWARIALPPDVLLAGGDLRGSLALAARDNSFSLRTTAPLVAAAVSLTRAGETVFGPADLNLRLSGEYALPGWSVDVHELSARSGGTTGLSLTGSIGRLAGAAQPLQFKGSLHADLPALLRQLGKGGATRLAAGRLTGDFRAVLAVRRDLEAHLALTDLAASPGTTGESLPAVTLGVKANWENPGRVELRLPLRFERAGRASDLNLAGFAGFAAESVGLEAKISSESLILPDGRLLLALLDRPAATATVAKANPFWSGLTGRVGLDLRQLGYGAGQEIRDVSGTVRLDPSSFRLDEGRATLSRGGELKLTAGLDFASGAAEPYVLQADAAVSDLEAGAWLLALFPARPPAVEGKFGATGRLTATAAGPAALLDRLQGRLRIESKGGTSRLLRTDLAGQIEESSTVTSLLGRAGSLVGYDRLENAANRAQYVAEAAKAIGEFKFDQLVVEVARGPDLGLRLTEFSLLSPEIRLTGTGEVRPAEGLPWLAQPLALRLQLLAQGHTGRLLNRAGLLGESVDPMGFSPFLERFTVEGTPGDPAAKELAAVLLKAANGSLLGNLRGK